VTGEFDARRRIVEIGRRLWTRGYVASNDGNISARIDRGRYLITPTGRSKGFLAPDDLVVVDGRGRKLAGALEPTSELPMHLFVYEARPDVHAVVHAHPPKATGFACAGIPLAQCVLPEVILSLGQIPLTTYATPSTQEVPESIRRFIGSYNAMLLRNHGALTLGADVFEAYYRMETVEHFAEIALVARTLGGPSALQGEDVRKLLRVRESLGVEGPTVDCVDCGACDAAGASPRQLPAAGTEAAAATGSSDEDIIEAVIREVRKALGER